MYAAGGEPPALAPMLATSAPPPPTFDGWLIEPKWDGCGPW